ncbi:multidrug resistance protein E [Lotmaria passim]
MSAFAESSSGSAAYVDAIESKLHSYDDTCQLRKKRLEELWGPEPPYEEQAEDQARWPWSLLLYTWLGDIMLKASREELTQKALPRPIRSYRAYNAGAILSHELQRQRAVEHGWDALCGTAVVRYTGVARAARDRLPRRVLRSLVRVMGWGGDDDRVTVAASGLRVGATGVLRWCGRVQQYDTGGQRYAGVEWDATAVAAAQDGGSNVAVAVGCVSAWHNGTVCGEHLFTTSDGRATATCECVEDVEITVPHRFSSHGDEAAGNGESADRLPSVVHVRPRGMSVARALFATLWKHMYRIIPIRVMRDTCTICVPLLLQYYIEYLEKAAADAEAAALGDGSVSSSKTQIWVKGLAIVLLYFVFIGTQTVTQNYYFFTTFRCACMFRAAISGAVFEKCLTISSKPLAHPHINTGHIVNLLSSDVSNVEQFTLWFWASIGSAAQLIAGVTLLYRMMGWPAFLGFGVMFLAVPLQSIMMRKAFEVFREKSVATDARLKATNEFLSGIRIVKFMSWEPSFIVKINELREIEIQKIKRIQLCITMISFLSAAIPNLVLAIVLFCYALSGHELKASIVFPAIALEGIIEMPFFCVPMIATAFTHFFVSMRRVSRFLECEDSEKAVIDMADEFEAEYQAETTAKGATSYEKDRQAFLDMYAASLNNATLSAFVAERLATFGSRESSQREGEKRKGKQNAKSGKEKKHDEEDDAVYELRTKALLTDVDLRIPRGRLTVVLGPTGSGKSTLLDSLIGALAVTRGRVACSRSVAYVPQQPWIMSATLRDNVVFFGAADAAAFERAVASSQLAADLALLADGAETEIGERGINLSGGQKARVSLARAVYADRDVYVLDDPLSALDAHVGERVMRECVCGALARKTRVLATHQVSAAAYADYVVLLQDGRVAFQGTYAAYRQYARLHYDRRAKDEVNFSLYAASTADQLGSSEDLCSLATVLPGSREEAEEAEVAPVDLAEKDSGAVTGSVVVAAYTEPKTAKQLLSGEEEKAVGAVPLTVYRRYMAACGGCAALTTLTVVFVTTECVLQAPDVWLSLWSSGSLVSLSQRSLLTTYVAVVVFGVFASPSRDYLVYTFLRRASYRLHENLLKSLAVARLLFFDLIPHGRLMNRMSRDMGLVDWDLPTSFNSVFGYVCYMLAYLVMMLTSQPFILVILVPCIFVYSHIFRFFCTANREMQRLLNISNSPVFAVLNEVLTGRWTICTYERQQNMMQQLLERLDAVFACFYTQCMGARWLAVRVELLGNIAVCALALLGVMSMQLSWMQTNVSLLALAVTRASSITATLSKFIDIGAYLEASMNCVERVLYYTDNAPAEDVGDDVAAAGVPAAAAGAGPAAGTAHAGSLAFEHVDMRYRPGLPLVLRDVCFAIAPGQKVGVVGRTGSGKSTLLLAFLRLVEVCGGRMLVCGRDARDYGVRELRQLFSMIPQDPLLFDGTVRSNVDPFGAAADAAVWAALASVGFVSGGDRTSGGTSGGGAGGVPALETVVQEGGSNFSVGQRQLLCLARALLKKGNAFILMDEATANVDARLDQTVQRVVAEQFRAYTVVTIAHRLHTVASYDMILVMAHGRVVECGSPRSLLGNRASAFFGMVAQSSAVMSAVAAGGGGAEGVDAGGQGREGGAGAGGLSAEERERRVEEVVAAFMKDCKEA